MIAPSQHNAIPRIALKAGRAGTFADNMRLPIHRWFRYSAGFSAEWVADIISANLAKGGIVLDPFSGSGTTLLAADSMGQSSIGYESHPFVAKIAQAKKRWHSSIDELIELAAKVESYHSLWKDYEVEASQAPSLLMKCYTPEALAQLLALRRGWEEETGNSHSSGAARLVWLALTAILRQCSGAGTAQWQYILPNQQKSRVAVPLAAFQAKIREMAVDMAFAQDAGWHRKCEMLSHDARSLPSPLEPASIDLVVTSPPYANNYDYADATRLEMTFWGEIEGWADLNRSVRKHIMRSCTQHAASDRVVLNEALADKRLDAIREEITGVCTELEKVRLTKGGKKNYHTMLAAYFLDMSSVILSLRKSCRDGARMVMVIGDSAPYGVHAPVDRWLGELAVHAGFKSFSFEKIRDRNTKWKNRKHTVPLHEGYLWIEG
ncbi:MULTISPECIES: DNA methyltransferase [Xanthomonas]|uniref:DNA methyltransferase n=1 Tax=Xanthomonas TaxID=338 RepID=UPI001CF8F943